MNVALATAACAQTAADGPSETRSTSWTCEDGRRVKVTYSRETFGATLTIDDGPQAELVRAPSSPWVLDEDSHFVGEGVHWVEESPNVLKAYLSVLVEGGMAADPGVLCRRQ